LNLPLLKKDPLRLPPFHFDEYPDPAFHFDADPALHFDVFQVPTLSVLISAMYLIDHYKTHAMQECNPVTRQPLH
jgi:hypothetical protein